MDKWQPIETAPKDGTPVLAPCGHGFLDVMVFDDGKWRETGNWMASKQQPSHWMRLPELPQS